MSGDPEYIVARKIASAVEDAIKEHMPPNTKAMLVFAVPTPRPMHYIFCEDTTDPQEWVTRVHFIFEQFENQLFSKPEDVVS